jgi:hypothetical protein
MSAQPSLERGYRRLLAAYPPAYRQRHEEEMLTVLLSGAEPGQRRPRLAEAADLIAGAGRIRLRLIQPYPGDAGRDALAMFTVFVPLLLAGPALATLVLHLVVTPSPGIPATVRPALRAALEAYWARTDSWYSSVRATIDLAAAGQIVIALAVLLRRRRMALTLVAITAGWWLLLGGYRLLEIPFEEFFLISYLLQAAALLTSAGPRRGLQLLTWKSLTVLAAAAAALTISWIFWMSLMFADFGRTQAEVLDLVLALVALFVIGLVVAQASRPGRYLVSLYVTMLYPVGYYLYRLATNEYWGHMAPLAAELLPPLIAGCAIVVVACRRPDRFGPHQRRGRSQLA